MYPRSDSPPPRQPSPDLIHIPLSSPPRIVRGRVTSLKPVPRLPQQLTTSRSYDLLDHQKRLRSSSRHLMNSRSCDNIRMRTDLQFSETSTINEDSPILPSPAKDHHISFRFPRPSTATLPPVPPLPAYLRMHCDDSDKSSQLSCDSVPSLTSKESIRRCKSPPPPPPPVKRRLVSFTRIRLFSWGESRSRSQAAAV